MNNTTIIFSDEAGQYYKKPNEKQIISDPFYVRSAVYLTTEEYIAFQKDIITLKKKYNLQLMRRLNGQIFTSCKRNAIELIS